MADETDTSYFDQDRIGSPLGASFEFNDTIGHMDMTPERVQYTGSDSSSEDEEDDDRWLAGGGAPVPRSRNSTAFLNFSFVSLPNLQELTKEKVVKFSPRVDLDSDDDRSIK